MLSRVIGTDTLRRLVVVVLALPVVGQHGRHAVMGARRAVVAGVHAHHGQLLGVSGVRVGVGAWEPVVRCWGRRRLVRVVRRSRSQRLETGVRVRVTRFQSRLLLGGDRVLLLLLRLLLMMRRNLLLMQGGGRSVLLLLRLGVVAVGSLLLGDVCVLLRVVCVRLLLLRRRSGVSIVAVVTTRHIHSGDASEGQRGLVRFERCRGTAGRGTAATA